jgi:hypothetical protein
LCEGRLGCNTLRMAGAAALAPALRQLPALQTLEYVCGWRAGEGGVAAGAGRRVVRLMWWVHVCGGKEVPCLTLFCVCGSGCMSDAQGNVCCDHVWDVVLCCV